MIFKYTFRSNIAGPKILIIGSIHGNETCGSEAIEQLRGTIANGSLEIKKGSIICIPYANHASYLNQTRQINVNLNRVFAEFPEQKDRMNESEKFAIAQIKDAITENDFILDLHSFGAGEDIPFIFKDIKNKELDTIGYAEKEGKIGFCFECGLKKSHKATDEAYQVILGVLSHFDMIDTSQLQNRYIQQKEITVTSVIRKPYGGQFTRPWKNFEYIPEETIIGTDKEGNSIVADQEAFILIPNESVIEGGEWCYLGVV